VHSLQIFSADAAKSNIFAKSASSISALIEQASDGRLTPQHGGSFVSSLGNTQHATGLALSAVKQMAKSGFLELLPKLLSNAAAALAGLSDAAILAWAAGTPEEGSAFLPSGSSTGSAVMLQNHAHASFSLFSMLWQDWPFTVTVTVTWFRT